MKPTEFDSLVNSASSSSSNNFRGAKNRGGFPQNTREARTRRSRWLVVLVLVLILILLGYRFLVRPWLFPLKSRPTKDRSHPYYPSTESPPYESPPSTFPPQTITPFTHIITDASEAPGTTIKQTTDGRSDIIPSPPITWSEKQNAAERNEVDPLSSLESRFKIQAEMDTSGADYSTRANPQMTAIVVGRLSPGQTSATVRVQPPNAFNRIQTTTPSSRWGGREKDEDYDDENRIWFERKPEGRPKFNPAAKAHPSINSRKFGPGLGATTSTTSASTTTTTNLPRKYDGSRIVHPHANSNVAGGSQTTQASKTEESPIDADIKDFINQLEEDVPVWRIMPEEMFEITPPPKPTEPTAPRFKVPTFSIHASVKTIPKHPSEQNDRRHKIDKRSETPIIVTCLLNIGRGDWIRFTRPYDLYLDYLMDLLRLDNRFIIYGDEEVEIFLAKQPDLDWDRIQFMRIVLSDLPFYRYRDEIAQIIEKEQKNWNETWDVQFQQHPEALFPDYNILVNSKPYLMHNATQISRFESEFFVWVDAGYSHGSKDLIPHGLWDPELQPGKITVIKITSELDKPERYTLDMVYRKRWDVISGGFLAGDIPTIRRFSVFFFKTFMSLLDGGKIDDDQTVLLLTIKNYASTFKLLVGGWFDAFKLVPSREYSA